MLVTSGKERDDDVSLLNDSMFEFSTLTKIMQWQIKCK